MYVVKVKDTTNGYIYELPYNGFTFTEELNKDKDARFSLDGEAIQTIANNYGVSIMNILGGGLREIWVERNGTKVYYGVITDVDFRSDDKGSISINVASVGFFTLFKKRIAGVPKRVFTSTDAGEIAWTLIDESQTSNPPYSDWGITKGSITPSKNRDRTFRFVRVKDAIEKLSNLYLKNGFDFEIDNNKQFNVFYPEKGSSLDSIIFDDRNILKWAVRRPLVLSMANQVHVLGDGFNDDVIYTTRSSPTAYMNVFGLVEEILSERDVKVVDTLNDKGDRYLSDYQSPINEVTIVTRLFDGYNLGDSVRVYIPDLDINGDYKRICRRSVSVDSNGLDIIQLLLK